MRSKITRREFLKSMGVLSVAGMQAKFLLGKPNQIQSKSDQPNILILLFDTLSAKHISLYGYRRETTPNLARIAARATVFNRHYSGGNFTTPGTASLLTGNLPWVHRAIHIRGTVTDPFKKKNLFYQFSQAGYKTLAYSHNPLVNILLEQFHEYINLLKPADELSLFEEFVFSDGLLARDQIVASWGERSFSNKGVDLDRGSKPASLFYSIGHKFWRKSNLRELTKEFKRQFPRGLPASSDKGILFLLEDAIDWIGDQVQRTSEPFLGYFHLFPPHAPYNTRRDFIDRFDDGWIPTPKKRPFFSPKRKESFLNANRQAYDEYISYVDEEFGRLYDTLYQSGVLENTFLIFTSDHGELFERGIKGHVNPAMYEPVVNIPLLILKPGQTQRVEVDTATSCIDLLPTLLHSTGQEIPSWVDGQILPTFRKQEQEPDPDPERSLFVVEVKENPKLAPLTKGTIALIKGQYKLIYYFGYDDLSSAYELYDVVKDPDEYEDLYDLDFDVATAMQNELLEKLQEMNQAYS